MLKNTKMQATGVMMLGIVLGYAAASATPRAGSSGTGGWLGQSLAASELTGPDALPAKRCPGGDATGAPACRDDVGQSQRVLGQPLPQPPRCASAKRYDGSPTMAGEDSLSPAPTPPVCCDRPTKGALVALALQNRRVAQQAAKSGKKPNICIIWGDDIGQSNLSCYTHGLMGYQTPNIDRIAQEGMMFTDYYGEQSCTAGRASFITGQHGLRTGLTKVGLPGATLGLRKEDPTIAELLKPLGYATGQFGKNHLGDRNEFLPTVHGFDEFYGNLYHLNADEEPELPDYPKDPAFRAKYGPRGVLDCKATDKDDATVDPRFGKVGKQSIKDTGPLTKKRMETIDDDIADRAADFIERQAEAGTPFFVWVNFTHMHFRTHVKPASKGQSGRSMSEYCDTMIDHDKNVGTVLKALDDAGIADNTLVMYSTDNGPHMNSWPDGAMTPFRNEKNSNWEGAYRVPCLVRWPERIQPGSVSNQIVGHHDWLPTIMAMAGDTAVADKLLKGHKVGNVTYKVHLDGYNLVPYLTADAEKSPRDSFLYCNDDQQLTGLRYENWKLVFMEQRAQGTLRIWAEPFTTLRVPKIFNLRLDPYERADITSNTYYDWLIDHAFLAVPAQDYVGKFLMTFKDYPQRQKAASFNLDEVMRKLQEQPGR